MAKGGLSTVQLKCMYWLQHKQTLLTSLRDRACPLSCLCSEQLVIGIMHFLNQQVVAKALTSHDWWRLLHTGRSTNKLSLPDAVNCNVMAMVPLPPCCKDTEAGATHQKQWASALQQPGWQPSRLRLQPGQAFRRVVMGSSCKWQ